MFRTVSPSGAPIGIRNIFHGIKAELCRDNSVNIFKEQMRLYFGSEYAFMLSSGKAALCLILKALTTISDRKEVIIPAYSSFCLASAVAGAGVVVKLCDIDPEYLDFDLEHLAKLVDDKTLAVIPVHLFGLVARLDEIAHITNSQGAYLIEDAAQAAGAEYKGKKVGTIGDAGIFSLGRGKSISTVEGGVVVTNTEEVATAVKKQFKGLLQPKSGEIALIGLAISIFLNPELYFIPNSLPLLNLGANIYDQSFRCYGFSNLQAGIGTSIFSRLDIYNNKRNLNANYLSSKLANPRIKLPKVVEGTRPSFTRYPVLIKDPNFRELIFDKLDKAGLGVSKNYPHPLSEIQDFKKYIINREDTSEFSIIMSKTLLTLPTHPYVKKQDLKKMIRILLDCMHGYQSEQ